MSNQKTQIHSNECRNPTHNSFSLVYVPTRLQIHSDLMTMRHSDRVSSSLYAGSHSSQGHHPRCRGIARMLNFLPQEGNQVSKHMGRWRKSYDPFHTCTHYGQQQILGVTLASTWGGRRRGRFGGICGGGGNVPENRCAVLGTLVERQTSRRRRKGRSTGAV